MPDNLKPIWPGWVTESTIGKGGFGQVYRITRNEFGIEEEAALKIITIPHDDSQVEELRSEGFDDASITQEFYGQVGTIVKEYKLMLGLRNCPNIVHCDDFRVVPHENGMGWDVNIKMELLTPILKAPDSLGSEGQILKLARDLCHALDVCQQQNILHRDIKPQNIFLAPDGNFKLGDFGIARTAERTTNATKGIGTYNYMAPEVLRGEPYGASADIYSLGLVLYWLLNERRQPFLPLPPATYTTTESEQARRRRFSGEKLPAPKHGSDALKKIVLKACEFNPKKRYQSAGEMLEALKAIGAFRSDPDKTVATPKQKQRHSAAPTDSADTTVLTESHRKPRDKKAAAVQRKMIFSLLGDAILWLALLFLNPLHVLWMAYNKKEKKNTNLWILLTIFMFFGWIFFAIVRVPDMFGRDMFFMERKETSVVQPQQDEQTAPAFAESGLANEPWQKNVLRYDDDNSDSLRISVDGDVMSVIFLDTLSDAPEDAVDISQAQDGSVVTWVEETRHNQYLQYQKNRSEKAYLQYVAANSGINGGKASPGLFRGWQNLCEIQFNGNFHTEEATDMSQMFFWCDNLRTLDVSTLDTASVTSMSQMFYGCENLTDLNLSAFDTSSVTMMNGMFDDCTKLRFVDVSSFDTSSVTTMYQMFSDCTSLTGLDIQNFDVSHVEKYGDFLPAGTFCTYRIGEEVRNNQSWEDLFTVNAPWRKNVLRYDNPGKSLDIDCDGVIMSVIFLDSTANAPADAVDFSQAQDGSVLSWLEETRDYQYVQYADKYGIKNDSPCYLQYVAADGGINAANACNSLFLNMGFVCDIFFNDAFHTEGATDMSSMFYGCDNLRKLDLSGFDTSSVTDMGHMFYSCARLVSLDLSGFDTSSVNNMYGMFHTCTDLRILDVSSFDTSNVYTMQEMFSYCTSIDKVNLSSFDTSSVNNMYRMFFDCDSLTSIDLSSFDTSSVTNMSGMFGLCENLQTANLSSFNTALVTNMSEMFIRCDNLRDYSFLDTFIFSRVQEREQFMNEDVTVDGSHWDTLFTLGPGTQCILKSDVSGIKLHDDSFFTLGIKRSHIISITFLDSLKEAPADAVDLSQESDGSVLGWTVPYEDSDMYVRVLIAGNGKIDARNCEGLFSGCINLEEINFSENFDTSKATSMAYMFSECMSLRYLDLTALETASVTNMERMFYYCGRLTELDVTSLDTSSVTNMEGMFSNVYGVEHLDMGGFDTSNVTNMRAMFSTTISGDMTRIRLVELNMVGWDTSKVTDMSYMFNGCHRLYPPDLSTFDFSSVTKYDHFMMDGKKTMDGTPWKELFR